MAVPPNQTAATAIDIGTLVGYAPFTLVTDAFDTGSSLTATLWYSYLPVTGDDMLEVYGYGNGTTYIPHLTIRSGPPPAATPLDNSHDSQSRPVQQDIVTFVTPGESVFFKFAPQGGTGNPNPSTLTIRIARYQKELIADGDLFINDSSPGYPGIVMISAGISATPKRSTLDFPAGEGLQVLTNGILAVIDAFNAKGPVIYDVASDHFTVRATPTMPDIRYTKSLSSNQIDTFCAWKNFGGNGFVQSFDQDGILIGSPLDTGSVNIITGVPQADLTAFYCPDDDSGPQITKITNPGGVRSLFVLPDATFSFGRDLLMMTDDTLLVPYEKSATDFHVTQYDLSANILSTTVLTGSSTFTLEHLFAAKEDPDFFWAWLQDDELNYFWKYRISDGVKVTSLSRMKFIESVSQTSVIVNDDVFSGADFSCFPGVLRISNLGTGIYILTGTSPNIPRVNHDNLWKDDGTPDTEDVAIPNPFYETFLAGDE